MLFGSEVACFVWPCCQGVGGVFSYTLIVCHSPLTAPPLPEVPESIKVRLADIISMTQRLSCTERL